jgi:hypothetical protein
VQFFKDTIITSCVIEIHEWAHAVLKVDTDDYFDRSKHIWKLQGDGAVGFQTGTDGQLSGTLAEFTLIEGRLDEEVKN